MPAFARSNANNRLLQRLPEAAFNLVAPYLETVSLPARLPLVEACEPIEYVYFIERGLASVFAASSDGKSVEVGQIGYEGISGYQVVLGFNRSPTSTLMLVAGEGLRIKADRFLRVLDNAAARLILLRYVYIRELQLAHSALAAAKYSMHQRLARWLLMCHDRLAGDVPVTHEFLAAMLGVRRSGITEHLHVLEGIHAIKSTRGNVRILDRRKLVEVAGGCYGGPEAEYERLIVSEEAPHLMAAE